MLLATLSSKCHNIWVRRGKRSAVKRKLCKKNKNKPKFQIVNAIYRKTLYYYAYWACCPAVAASFDG